MLSQPEANFSEIKRHVGIIHMPKRRDSNHNLHHLISGRNQVESAHSSQASSEAVLRVISSANRAPYSSFVARLTELVKENIGDETYDINRLCRDVGASRSKIHNRLKQWTGLSTSKFIRHIRLQKAKEILLYSDLNITQVAYEVGFKDSHYFSRVFSQSYGICPIRFRKRALII
ncbi:MAG: helix-turn-helix transcriptional regulator [Phaeodactylibacter sp.]|nr:helix-turn-helix transcriptional regulator [Phaeodactylibacter sp.]